MESPWSVRVVIFSDAKLVGRHRYFLPTESEHDVERYAAWVEPRIKNGVYLGAFALNPALEVVAGAGATLVDGGPTRGVRSGLQARIVNVFTEPPHRRRGMAEALVRHLIARCDGLGVGCFVVGTPTAGAGLYARLGFAYANEMVLTHVPNVRE